MNLFYQNLMLRKLLLGGVFLVLGFGDGAWALDEKVTASDPDQQPRQASVCGDQLNPNELRALIRKEALQLEDAMKALANSGAEQSILDLAARPLLQALQSYLKNLGHETVIVEGGEGNPLLEVPKTSTLYPRVLKKLGRKQVDVVRLVFNPLHKQSIKSIFRVSSLSSQRDIVHVTQLENGHGSDNVWDIKAWRDKKSDPEPSPQFDQYLLLEFSDLVGEKNWQESQEPGINSSRDVIYRIYQGLPSLFYAEFYRENTPSNFGSLLSALNLLRSYAQKIEFLARPSLDLENKKGETESKIDQLTKKIVEMELNIKSEIIFFGTQLSLLRRQGLPASLNESILRWNINIPKLIFKPLERGKVTKLKLSFMFIGTGEKELLNEIRQMKEGRQTLYELKQFKEFHDILGHYMIGLGHVLMLATNELNKGLSLPQDLPLAERAQQWIEMVDTIFKEWERLDNRYMLKINPSVPADP